MDCSIARGGLKHHTGWIEASHNVLPESVTRPVTPRSPLSRLFVALLTSSSADRRPPVTAPRLLSAPQGRLASERDLALQGEQRRLDEGGEGEDDEDEEDEPWAMADLDLRKTKSDPQLTVAGECV